MIYPEYILKDCKSAIIFFCAAFGGKQDAVFFKKHKIKNVTLVDDNNEKLWGMAGKYPSSWTAWFGDYKEFLNKSNTPVDIISLDPWTTMEIEIINRLDDFLKLAKKYLVISISKNNGYDLLVRKYNPMISERRSNLEGGVYWGVIEK